MWQFFVLCLSNQPFVVSPCAWALSWGHFDASKSLDYMINVLLSAILHCTLPYSILGELIMN